MKLSHIRLATVCCVTALSLSLCSVARSMTIQLGSGGADLIAPGDAWQFLRGSRPASVPADAWKEADFDDASWETGPSGFGFGDDDDATVLTDMQNSYLTVYIRKMFAIPSDPGEGMLQLVMDYDDGFIAYLNGKEVARRSMPAGAATHTTAASSHEAGTPETIVLGRASELLREGVNVLAIEGHNASLSSSDFSLIPSLRIASDTRRAGDVYICDSETVLLTGRTDALATSTLLVDGTVVAFDTRDGAWQARVSLAPGMNTITARSLDVNGDVIDSGAIEILFAPQTERVGGELTEDVVLSGACTVESSIAVPAGRVLTILPGTILLMKKGVSIVVYGQLVAEGTEKQPIHFTRDSEGATWKQILFVGAIDSSFAWCTFEYADSEGAHQDYYEAGPRDYHEAIVAIACHISLKNCTFQRLPDDSAGAEGDAIAIISDDPDCPGEASAHIASCRFLKIGQGVHTRYSYVLVEDCCFTGKRGDNDDVDLWGESTPTPLIQNNVFLYPEHDDTINPTRCSARIIGNLIVGTDDHGIVLRDKGFPLVMNNVIIDCANGGIAIENSCDATLINNTIVNCGRGLRLFDLGRWDAPYHLNPGGGTATIINCIIWDCPTPIALADSSNTQIADRGSHVTVLYSDIQRGRNGVSVSGQQSTVTWGPGNIDADPLLADIARLDAHLQSQFGRWDPAIEEWVNDASSSPCIDAGDPNLVVTFESFPNGGRINMGAYGNTAQASKSKSGPLSGTSQYTFLPDQSAILQTGGFAGVHWTYRLEGSLKLTVDFETGAASFSQVAATAAYDGPFPRTLDANEVFNMTSLSGAFADDRTIRFTGKAPDGSDVALTATFESDLVYLTAQTTPPPNSADFFVFTLDAQVRRE